MAGSGRKTNYRKSVQNEYLESFPEPDENTHVAQMLASRGSNIIEITLEGGTQSLAILPRRFRKLIWVKRGDFILVRSSVGEIEISTGNEGKVRHRIEHVLSKTQVKHLKGLGKWPKYFNESEDTPATPFQTTQNYFETGSDGMDQMFQNPNRVSMQKSRIHCQGSDEDVDSDSS